MADLTFSQQLVLNDITSTPVFNKAPDTGSFKYDGIFFGDWNANTLKALEKKGVLDFCGVCRDGKTKFVTIADKL